MARYCEILRDINTIANHLIATLAYRISHHEVMGFISSHFRLSRVPLSMSFTLIHSKLHMSFINHICITWNNLSAVLKNSVSLSSFTHYLKSLDTP